MAISFASRLQKIDHCVGGDETNCVFKIIIPALEEIGWSAFDNFGLGFEIEAGPYNNARKALGLEHEVKAAQIATAADMVVHDDPTVNPVTGYFVLEAKPWGQPLRDKQEKKVRVYAHAIGLAIGVLTNGAEWRICYKDGKTENLILPSGNPSGFIIQLSSTLGHDTLTNKGAGRVVSRDVLNIGYSRVRNWLSK